MSTVITTEKPASSNGSAKLHPTAMDEIVRESKALACSIWTPAHLKSKDQNETIATCTALVVMARKWNMAAGMVAGETYSVHGKVGFQGKLYAALANAFGGLNGGLRVIYHGAGESLAAVVFGVTSGCEFSQTDRENVKKLVKSDDSEAATDLELSGVKAIRVPLSAVKTDNKMWSTDPKQKLFYTGSTKWCRRFMPDLVLGAVSVEDIDRMEYEERVRVMQTESGNRTERLEAKISGMLTQQDQSQASSPQDA